MAHDNLCMDSSNLNNDNNRGDNKMSIFSRVKKWSSDRRISEQKPYQDSDWEAVQLEVEKLHLHLKLMGVNGYVLNKLEELAEYAEAQNKDDWQGVIDAIADSTIYDMTELLKEETDIEDVLDEVVKTIESRVGEWNEELGKFQKYKSDEAMARWYTPEYKHSGCKVVL